MSYCRVSLLSVLSLPLLFEDSCFSLRAFLYRSHPLPLSNCSMPPPIAELVALLTVRIRT